MVKQRLFRVNIDSLKGLTQFLRQSRGLSTKLEPGNWLKDDDVPYLTQVLEQRVARLGDAGNSIGSGSELDEVYSTFGRRKAMTSMAKSDLANLVGALEMLKPMS